jgi:very-short-patch-repair endonuclease
LDAIVGRLAGRQHGVVSLAQLRELGIARHAVDRRLQAGRWYQLHRGVYAVGHEALTWRSHLIAAVHACGSTAVASHRAAGALHGLLSSQRIEVSAPRGCKPKPGIAIHRPRPIRAEDRTDVDEIPVTTVARTLVDLADVLDDERLAKAVHQAEILRTFDLQSLEAAERRAGKRKGRHRLARVLAAYQPEPHFLRSEAERELKRLCESHSLPQPQFNAWVEGHEVDAYWPEAKLALEVDGAATHRTGWAFREDRRRDRALAREGVQVVRATWRDLHDGLADELKEILARR